MKWFNWQVTSMGKMFYSAQPGMVTIINVYEAERMFARRIKNSRREPQKLDDMGQCQLWNVEGKEAVNQESCV